LVRIRLRRTLTLVSRVAVALPMLLPFTLVTALGPALSLSTSVLLGTGYIAIFGSVIDFLFWSYGVAKLRPGRAGQSSTSCRPSVQRWCLRFLGRARCPRRRLSYGARSIRHRADRAKVHSPQEKGDIDMTASLRSRVHPGAVERSISQRGGWSGAFRMRLPSKVTQQMRG
jgi:hypothetical protein